MATITAKILVGCSHQNHGGILPTHLIRLSENSKPKLILTDLGIASDNVMKKKVVIPTLENTVDDIYLMIAVYILKKITLEKDMYNKDGASLYEIFEEKERFELYNQTKKIIESINLKVVFNIFDADCLLKGQIEEIKKYPPDIEITTPSFSKYYNAWKDKVVTREF